MLARVLRYITAFVSASEDPGAGRERRKVVRLKCKIPVRLLPESGAPLEAMVVDLGLKGLCLRCCERLQPEEVYRVQHPGRSPEFEVQEVRCKVRWVRERRFSDSSLYGLAFHDSRSNIERSWIRYILNCLGLDEANAFQRRVYLRARLDVPVTIEGEPARLLDLGLGGALLEGLALKEGESKVLCLGPWSGLEGLELAGQVVESRIQEGSPVCAVRWVEPAGPQLQLLGKYVLRGLQV